MGSTQDSSTAMNAQQSSTQVTTAPGHQYIYDFQRFEYKYAVPNAILGGLIHHVSQFMDFDLHSDGDTYPLHSIYFDSPEESSFYEKIAGVERRKKFRIRSYYKELKPSQNVFFEVKEKAKDIILKRRFAVPFSQINDVVTHQGDIDDPTYKEWQYHLHRQNLTPRILIEYDRLAFVPRSPIDLRITFDQNLRFAKVNEATDFSVPTKAVEVMKGYSVVEIKFRHFIPKWTHQFIQKYNLRNDAFSKFCESLIYDYKLQGS